MPSGQFFSYIMARTNYIQWDDVCFELDQHALLNIYSASPREQQFVGRHALFSPVHLDALFWLRDNQFLFLLLNAAYLAEKQQILIL